MHKEARRLGGSEEKADMRHCDEYINDPGAHPALRAFLEYQRRPAIERPGVGPKLFAIYNGRDELAAGCTGKRCRVVMASRFGDVGIRFSRLNQAYGYSVRCAVGDLSDFTDKF